jgi:hypothetical protein
LVKRRVEEPEVEVLQGGADSKDVVVRADDPEGRVLLHHAAAGGKPGAGEGVVGGKTRELVPVVVDRIDEALVRARERPLELEVVGRVGEDRVDALWRQAFKRRHTVADQDFVERKRRDEARLAPRPRRRRSPPGTRDMDPGDSAGGPGTRGTHG